MTRWSGTRYNKSAGGEQEFPPVARFGDIAAAARQRTFYARVVDTLADKAGLAELAAGIERDPAEVARRARELARAFRADEDWANLCRAQAVLGRAWRILGEVDLAQHALTEAISVAGRVDDDDLAADAHLALAGVLSLGAASTDAFEHLDEVERIGSAAMRASASLQRAVLCLRSGRTAEALELFDAAVPRLRREESTIDLARVLANRGGILLRRGDVVDAIADFRDAEDLFGVLGQRFAALQVHHNLACAVAARGDLPAALQMFDETTSGFAELGHDDSVPLLSRAEALLANGLSSDAFGVAQEAVERLEAEGNHSAAAESLIVLAEAARQEGDTTVALAAARRAEQWFESADSEGWRRAALMLVSRIRLDAERVDRSLIHDLEQLAAAAAEDGDTRGEATAWALMANANVSTGDIRAATSSASSASAAARRSRLVQTRLAALHARATVCLAADDRAGARRTLRRALDLLESAVVPGVGLSGGDVGVNAHDIARLAARVAASERRPVSALTWMERARRAVPAAHPVLPPESNEVAELVARMRIAAADLRRAEVEDRPTAEPRHQLHVLENQVRRSALTMASNDSGDPLGSPRDATGEAYGDPTDVRELPNILGRREMVSIGVAGNHLMAVVASRNGFRICELGTTYDVTAHASRARTALNGLARTDLSQAVAETHRSALRAAAAGLDVDLVAPLGLRSDEVVLVVPPFLHSVPWAALPTLRSRAFSLAPSASWWMGAASSAPVAIDRVLVVAGPRLGEAGAEATQVARCHDAAVLLRGASASVGRVCHAIGDADLVHVVAHGRFRHDNPLWSTIELDDGMLTVYELERIASVPSMIVLATCDSGLDAASGPHGGAASLHGLAATLVSMGARTVVASVGALPDTAETRRVMVALHRGMVAGATAAQALAAVRTREAEDCNDGDVGVASAGLITLGVG